MTSLSSLRPLIQSHDLQAGVQVGSGSAGCAQTLNQSIKGSWETAHLERRCSSTPAPLRAAMVPSERPSRGASSPGEGQAVCLTDRSPPQEWVTRDRFNPPNRITLLTDNVGVTDMHFALVAIAELTHDGPPIVKNLVHVTNVHTRLT